MKICSTQEYSCKCKCKLKQGDFFLTTNKVRRCQVLASARRHCWQEGALAHWRGLVGSTEIENRHTFHLAITSLVYHPREGLPMYMSARRHILGFTCRVAIKFIQQKLGKKLIRPSVGEWLNSIYMLFIAHAYNKCSASVKKV